jgi:hypothetical protein
MSRLPIAVFLLLLSPLLTFAAEWQGRMNTEDGILRVHNPDAAILGEATFALEEMWRLAGDDEESEDFFGVIGHVALGEDGNSYLLDEQLNEVKVYSADGEFITVIGREGEGPGEFRRPGGLFFLPDGRLAVLQSRPARIILLNTDGTPAGDIALPDAESGGFRFVREAELRDGLLAMRGMTFLRNKSGGERSTRLVLMDRDTGALTTLDAHSSRIDFSRPVVRERDSQYFWGLLPGGRMLLVDDFDYRLRIFGGDGVEERRIEVDYPDLMRSGDRQAERRAELAANRSFGGRHRRRAEPEVEVESREPGIRWLGLDGSGLIWVLSGRGIEAADDEHLGCFDVFDGEGRLVHRITLAGEGDLSRDRFLIRGDRLIVLKEYREARRAMFGATDDEEEEFYDEAEPMSVICYRLPELDL